MAKTLNIQPFISGETATYLRQYFQPGQIQVLEDHFCNHNALPSIIFNEDLDYLVEHTELHKGKILQLWPWGYKVVLKRNNYICNKKWAYGRVPKPSLFTSLHPANMKGKPYSDYSSNCLK